jgi:signal transduction histidine kinase
MGTGVGRGADSTPLAATTVSPDELPDGVIVIGADARVTVFNTAAERITGLSAADVVGSDVRESMPLQDREGNNWWTATDPWGGLATRSGHRERSLLMAGSRELLVTTRYVRAGRGQPVERVIVGLRDTENRRRAEIAQAQLLSTVAHELRSPLTSVKGFSATLLRRWDRFSDDQKRLMLETIEADADRVTRLISELLDISRIDAGRLEVRRQPVDLVAAAHKHVERMVASGYDDHRFVVKAPQPLPEVWADPDRVDQVLGNLLENAVRHGSGTVTLTVVPDPVDLSANPNGIGASSQQGAVAVSVADEGEGIQEDHYPLVFTRFWHGRSRGGTGLGLYVVRGLVEAHGGRISVGRAEGGGAMFRFTLPAGAPEHLA